MLTRTLTDRLQRNIEQYPAVALLGARQVGKTTLAGVIAKHQSSIYLDLEAPEDLLKLCDPGSYLSHHDDKLIILDEIQRVPELFNILRGIIDKNRRKDKHFNSTCEDVDATKKFVVYGGDEEFPVGDGVTMISLRHLMEKLQSKG